ncbi:MAG: CD225/dispanin family protein [Flavobacteriaceae bacterium]|jgi:hypothetical protein|nr:CD225/dispanin family protein [Flavobacteriaceae bacterium]
MEQIDKNTEKIKQPNNYLAFAVLSTVACFAPVGIFALLYSIKVNRMWYQGNVAGAKQASLITRTLCIWTIIAGIIFWIGILSGASYNIFGTHHRQHL